ncbi:MAG: hypothetical protein KIT31_03850 [Deltaproteobacteria bacterium]|nr:hypothetical protein [Deltaproteobacteria bacterium]
MAIALGAPPAGGPSGWNAVTPHRLAEPRLEAWAASLLGAPMDIRCRARAGAAEEVVSLADLGLGALDFVDLARRESPGELDARVLWRARTQLGGSLTLDYARDTAWPMSVLSFPEALEVARCLADVIGASRPLTPGDLALAGVTIDAGIAEGDLAGRLASVSARMSDVRGALDGAIAAVAAPSPPADLDPLRTAIWAATGFGTAAPVNLAGGDAAVRAALLEQARAVSAELARRAAAAASGPSALPRLAALFAGTATILPPFTPLDGPALDAALAHGPALVGEPLTPRKWFERTARVREPVGALRLAAIAVEATSAARIELSIAQLPHVPGARWIALPFDRNDPAQRPRPGTCSIAFVRALDFPAGGTWAGLLVDEWAEAIPSDTQLTAFAVHHDAPGAEAAQCVLLAVPPPQNVMWDLPTLLDTVGDTLDLAALRALDSELAPLKMLAPCIYLAANVADEAVGFDAGRHVMQDVQILAPE